MFGLTALLVACPSDLASGSPPCRGAPGKSPRGHLSALFVGPLARRTIVLLVGVAESRALNSVLRACAELRNQSLPPRALSLRTAAVTSSNRALSFLPFVDPGRDLSCPEPFLWLLRAICASARMGPSIDHLWRRGGVGSLTPPARGPTAGGANVLAPLVVVPFILDPGSWVLGLGSWVFLAHFPAQPQKTRNHNTAKTTTQTNMLCLPRPPTRRAPCVVWCPFLFLVVRWPFPFLPVERWQGTFHWVLRHSAPARKTNWALLAQNRGFAGGKRGFAQQNPFFLRSPRSD